MLQQELVETFTAVAQHRRGTEELQEALREESSQGVHKMGE